MDIVKLRELDKLASIDWSSYGIENWKYIPDEFWDFYRLICIGTMQLVEEIRLKKLNKLLENISEKRLQRIYEISQPIYDAHDFFNKKTYIMKKSAVKWIRQKQLGTKELVKEVFKLIERGLF